MSSDQATTTSLNSWGNGLGISPNTVQLDAEDGGDGWAGGLAPVAVAGAFDVPAGHLAFDQPRVRPEASDRVQSSNQQDDGTCPAGVGGLRGKNRAPVTASVG